MNDKPMTTDTHNLLTREQITEIQPEFADFGEKVVGKATLYYLCDMALRYLDGQWQDGFVSVPRQATNEMKDMGTRSIGKTMRYDNFAERAQDWYDAMIATFVDGKEEPTVRPPITAEGEAMINKTFDENTYRKMIYSLPPYSSFFSNLSKLEKVLIGIYFFLLCVGVPCSLGFLSYAVSMRMRNG